MFRGICSAGKRNSLGMRRMELLPAVDQTEFSVITRDEANGSIDSAKIDSLLDDLFD